MTDTRLTPEEAAALEKLRQYFHSRTPENRIHMVHAARDLIRTEAAELKRREAAAGETP